MQADISPIRPSPIAGTWYPANPQRLRATLTAYLADAQPPKLSGQPCALIVPHAGHIYSGPVAACAFKAIMGRQFDQVLIIAPSHHYYPQPVLTSAHQAYSTPLGEVPLARGLVDAISQHLTSSMGFGITPIAYDQEHALEIELPFLQVVQPKGFTLVPLMLRDQSPATARALAASIAACVKDKNVLLVASSDLSHFHSEKQAHQLDRHILDAITAFDADALYQAQANAQGEACGLGPMAAILWASRLLGADHAQVVCHATSANITGDTHSVVGYGAAIISHPA